VSRDATKGKNGRVEAYTYSKDSKKISEVSAKLYESF